MKRHDFDAGAQPFGGLVQTVDGFLFGTTQFGGAFGLGTVFRYEANGTFTTIHSFSDADGRWPIGDLLLASDGNIYGTTLNGGDVGNGDCIGYGGCGTIFQLTPGGILTTLHAFNLSTDGAEPEGGLVQAMDGELYGAARAGGLGAGTLFRITTAGASSKVLMASSMGQPPAHPSTLVPCFR